MTTDDGLERVRRIGQYDWAVLTSPSAVRSFGELLRKAGVDLRTVPRIATCGGGTSQELGPLGLKADLEPAADFSADGLLAALAPRVTKGTRILRLRSDKAGPAVARTLTAAGAVVDDCVLYRNEPIEHAERPAFDVAYFASASAVEVFEKQWGAAALKGVFVVAIGKPTLAALTRCGVTADLVPPQATVESSLEALALHFVVRSSRDIKAKLAEMKGEAG